ncbi:MAG: hypothetical protein ABI422_05695 [Sphingomicrobium sp.]
MKRLVAVAALLMAGCSAGKPPENVVAGIERRLSQDPCLRNLNSLRRTYYFRMRGGKIDRNLIGVDIMEAGHRGLPAGRFIEAEAEDILDDSQYFGAQATYVVSTGQLDIWACGMNFGGIRHAPRF